jgi:transcriptional regulator with XRE-family HTH domain
VVVFISVQLKLSLTMNKEQIGQAIAEARKAQGITIRKMAELANTSPRAIQAVEKGWYNVGIETYLKLAETLHISIKVGE